MSEKTRAGHGSDVPDGAPPAVSRRRGRSELPSSAGAPPSIRRVGDPRGGPVELELQPVLDALPFYVIIVDADHTVLMANAAVRATLGVAPEEIVGRFCPRVVHGIDAPYAGCPLEQAVAAGGGGCQCYLREEGTGRDLHSTVYPTCYETTDGRPVFVHTVHDVSEQRAAERRIERSLEVQELVNEVLRMALGPGDLVDILQQVIDRIVALPWLSQSPRGAILLADDTGQRLELAAHSGMEPDLTRRCAVVPFGACLCGRAAQTGQVQFAAEVDDDHDHGCADMPSHGHYCVPIVHRQRVLGVLSTVVDEGHEWNDDELDFLHGIGDVLAGIIQRKRTEEAARDHQRVALSRERMARVGEMSAGVVHTVRNPLHGVLSCVEILESQAQRGEAASTDVLGLLRDGLQRIERVTRRLLSLTRDGESSRVRTPVDALLHDVCDLATLQAERRGVALTVEQTEDLAASLDADRVVEGLNCVVSNALDACRPGDRVTVRAGVTPGSKGTLVIEVQDTGVGIVPEHRSRVLDPFFTTKPIGEGSGLGLAIVRGVMDEHDGEVQLDSRPDEGTTVRLVFPRAVLDR